MNTRNVQKKVAEEKTNEVKGEEKVESQKPTSVNPEPVTANALDVIAKQNIGLQGLSKPKEIDKGETGNTEWYDNLVTQWNQNHNNWSMQEQVDFVTQIIDVAPPNKVSYWHSVRAELRAQIMEENLYNIDLQEAYPPSYLGGYQSDYINDQEGLLQDMRHAEEIIGNPNNYSKSELLQALKAEVARYKMSIARETVVLNSPHATIDDKIIAVHAIDVYRTQIEDIQRRINQLGLVIDDSVATQAQVNTQNAD
jgi:hypothetical protein